LSTEENIGHNIARSASHSLSMNSISANVTSNEQDLYFNTVHCTPHAVQTKNVQWRNTY